MSLAPFYAAPPVIQFHIIAALLGLVIGPFVLFRLRRDRLHKMLGYTWIMAIIAVSVSGLMIESSIAVIGHLGPIHLFSVFSLCGLGEGLWHIKRGNIAKHRASMQSVWFGAMGLAGLFTFLPGRTMNQIVFGGPSDAGWIIIAVGVAALAWGWRGWLRRAV